MSTKYRQEDEFVRTPSSTFVSELRDEGRRTPRLPSSLSSETKVDEGVPYPSSTFVSQLRDEGRQGVPKMNKFRLLLDSF